MSRSTTKSAGPVFKKVVRVGGAVVETTYKLSDGARKALSVKTEFPSAKTEKGTATPATTARRAG